MEGFQHKPLDQTSKQIRLIKLSKGARDTQPRCVIRHFTLDDPRTPDYKALSYTWGPPTPLHPLVVNEAVFYIRTNLYDFLCMQQVYIAKPCWLWIDQLCIDQADVQERNQQVSMMAEIYKTASEVIVWLGAADKYTETAVRFLGASEERKKELFTKPCPSDSPALRTWRSDTHAAMQHLGNLPYWSRLWILQEVVLAQERTAFWGYRRIPWHQLIDYNDRVAFASSASQEDLLNYEEEALEYLALGDRNTSGSGRGGFQDVIYLQGTNSLSQLVLRFMQHGCEDPRDKIYGLLAVDAGLCGIKVDYMKSAGDVWMDTVVALIQERTNQWRKNKGFKVENSRDLLEWMAIHLFLPLSKAMKVEESSEARWQQIVVNLVCRIAEDIEEPNEALQHGIRSTWVARKYKMRYSADTGG